MNTPQEKRKHKRVNSHLMATCVTDQHHTIKVPLTGKDISEGGLRVTTNRELIKGGQVLVYLQLPREDKRLEIPAEIVWIKPSETQKDWFLVGMKFLFIGEEQQQQLRDFINRHFEG